MLYLLHTCTYFQIYLCGKSIAEAFKLKACSFDLKCGHPSQQTYLWEDRGLPLAFLSHILFLPLHCQPLCIYTLVKYLNSL